jgi:microcystin-dependent protein
MNPYLGEIRIFPFTFAPHGWAMCNGQLIPITQMTALFSLLGTFYGGNGTTTFALPNLQGTSPIGYTTGNPGGLSTRELGETGGVETVTLLPTEMPAHTHTVSTGDGTTPSSATTQGYPDNSPARPYEAGPSNTSFAADSLQGQGGNQPHNNLSPYLALNFCIATAGIFPSRP